MQSAFLLTLICLWLWASTELKILCDTVNQTITAGGRCCHEWNNFFSSTSEDLFHCIHELGCLGHCGHLGAAQPVSQCQLALADYRQCCLVWQEQRVHPRDLLYCDQLFERSSLVRPCLRPTVLWKYIVVLNLLSAGLYHLCGNQALNLTGCV